MQHPFGQALSEMAEEQRAGQARQAQCEPRAVGPGVAERHDGDDHQRAAEEHGGQDELGRVPGEGIAALRSDAELLSEPGGGPAPHRAPHRSIRRGRGPRGPFGKAVPTDGEMRFEGVHREGWRQQRALEVDRPHRSEPIELGPGLDPLDDDLFAQAMGKTDDGLDDR